MPSILTDTLELADLSAAIRQQGYRATLFELVLYAFARISLNCVIAFCATPAAQERPDDT